jgi:hypothetical protein
MKYSIPSSYHSDSQHPLVTAWIIQDEGNSQLSFLNWLYRETGSDRVRGNFEDGWTIEFLDEAKYTWFLLKWGTA